MYGFQPLTGCDPFDQSNGVARHWDTPDWNIRSREITDFNETNDADPTVVAQ
jgi:hypothetical protein